MTPLDGCCNKSSIALLCHVKRRQEKCAEHCSRMAHAVFQWNSDAYLRNCRFVRSQTNDVRCGEIRSGTNQLMIDLQSSSFHCAAIRLTICGTSVFAEYYTDCGSSSSSSPLTFHNSSPTRHNYARARGSANDTSSKYRHEAKKNWWGLWLPGNDYSQLFVTAQPTNATKPTTESHPTNWGGDNMLFMINSDQ